MAPTQPPFHSYTISFYLEGFKCRQLATVNSARNKQELIHFIEDIEGVLTGQWHQLPDRHNTYRRS
ncbi:hypothetical protein BDN70DRAFT_887890 [Pholiota conissans]|uniref:Uncharacterized protein n=1 Tax=Pholiota conissans TaxID=109636 RepID=A0A9P6CT12_9AGAR|nr:hypothetical protein BDN70DRAFT_887890 [Pholiota conissans]